MATLDDVVGEFLKKKDGIYPAVDLASGSVHYPVALLNSIPS